MRYTKIEINGLNAMVDITKFIMEKFPRAYCSANEKLNVLIVEDFSYMTFTTFTLTIIIANSDSKKTNSVQLEIIGSGSGNGLINFDWWKTRREIKNLYSSLSDFSKEKEFYISELNIELREYNVR
ncbi:MAG TPA: hypothetical protein PLD02_09790 [Saprospiraceae bacterium]|nr:hypothetical protein [Saprospiraceae bacterium]